MICGDPFFFAIQFDVVKPWCVQNDIWVNGVFTLYIEGDKLFDIVDVFELKTILSFYTNSPVNKLCTNDINIDAVKLYKNAENYFTGDGEDLIDGLFYLTCTAMEDNGIYLYFIKTSAADRLVWSKDNGSNVHETILPSGTISDVINQLHHYQL
ncbi:immunity 42 family protein [Providencia rettgeri]|nr:immunity 42 family protein [Providencia rettgeri]